MFPRKNRSLALVVGLLVVLGVLGLGEVLADVASVLIWALILGALGYVAVQFWRRYGIR